MVVERVAALAVSKFDKKTGTVRNVIEQCRYLRQSGYRCIILSEKMSASLLAEAGATGVRFWRWPFKGNFRLYWFSRRVTKWALKNKPDIFFSHVSDVGAASADVLVMHNAVALYKERVSNLVSDELVDFHRRLIEQGKYRKLIVNSNLMKRDFSKRYNVPEEKMVVFYQGVNSSVFNTEDLPRKRRAGRMMVGVSEGDILVGLITSGAFEKRNVSLFIDIAKIISNRSTRKVSFIVVGKSGSKAIYESRVDELGLSERFFFVQPVEKVDLLFHALDVHVFPALLEEYGRVILEGLACGVPSVVSSAVGASELMLSGGLDQVMDGYDPGEWASVCLKIIENDHLRAELSEKASGFALRYTENVQAEEMSRLLSELTQS